jgi:hypothetical protein
MFSIRDIIYLECGKIATWLILIWLDDPLKETSHARKSFRAKDPLKPEKITSKSGC